jgi:hypothetical protein
MVDEAHVYLVGIRTRIEWLGARFNASNATQLQKAMDDLRHHTTLVPTLHITVEASTITPTPSSSITTTTTSTGVPVMVSKETKDASSAMMSSMGSTEWRSKCNEWQLQHERLRDQLFAEMRECSLKSAVDNALFMVTLDDIYAFTPIFTCGL